ncbi:hypothetical protein DIPPA_05914 [Diplonema papillatum]|nr:hypothetical protein DIPPA_05914 [Diplonema papillatum]
MRLGVLVLLLGLAIGASGLGIHDHLETKAHARPAFTARTHLHERSDLRPSGLRPQITKWAQVLRERLEGVAPPGGVLGPQADDEL